MSKAILVTGGGRGIGRAIVQRLGCAGHRVALSYRNDRCAAEAVAALLSDRQIETAVLQADLADPADARALPARVFARFGRLDALINNAGVTDDGEFLALEPERYAKVLATNLFGVMRLTGAALPYLQQSPEPAIVMVASLGGIVGKEGQVAYTASKGGLIGLALWLGKLCSGAGIRVNVVAPGFIDTDMTAGLKPSMIDHIVKGSALGRVGRAEEVAEAVNFLLTPGYIQSSTIRMDGGFSR